MDARNGSVMHFWALFRVVVLKLTKGSFVSPEGSDPLKIVSGVLLRSHAAPASFRPGSELVWSVSSFVSVVGQQRKAASSGIYVAGKCK